WGERGGERGVVDAALVDPVREGGEERTRVTVDPAPRLGLAHALDGLTAGGDEPLANALGEALLVGAQALGHEPHATGDHLPVRLRPGRHPVQAPAPPLP